MERDIRDEIAEEDPAVGGRIDPDDNDAARPLEEAGQGVSEGFELAEDELIEAASHGDGAGDPVAGRFSPEAESDRSPAVYSEPDEEKVSEVTSDPGEGGDDPGSGPGITHER